MQTHTHHLSNGIANATTLAPPSTGHDVAAQNRPVEAPPDGPSLKKIPQASAPGDQRLKQKLQADLREVDTKKRKQFAANLQSSQNTQHEEECPPPSDPSLGPGAMSMQQQMELQYKMMQEQRLMTLQTAGFQAQQENTKALADSLLNGAKATSEIAKAGNQAATAAF